MKHHDPQRPSFASISAFAPTITLVVAVSLSAAVAEQAAAQARVQSSRVSPQMSGGASASGPRSPSVAAGQGRALGDGNAMGGQTFSWMRGSGISQRMGSGNLLDANTQVGSGGVNRGIVSVDYNSRNLLVTGNVAGGRGFRGSVGYTADRDFRGTLGSDATFRFEADSAYSNIVFNSSNYSRDRFLLAQGLGAFEYRRESTPLSPEEQRASAGQPESRLRLDRANTQMAIGRMNDEAGEDRTIATGVGAGGESVRYIVSPLRGLQAEKLDDPIVRSGLSLYEQARARQEIASGIAKPEDFDPRARAAERGMFDPQIRPEDAAATARETAARLVAPGYLDILKAVDLSAATEADARPKTTLDEIRGELDRLRRGAREEKPADATTEQTPDEMREERNPPADPTGIDALLEPRPPAQRLDERNSVRERRERLTVEQMADVLRHGGRIEKLSTDDERRLNQLIRQGEQSLRDGDYFMAERRFMQAQAYRFDNPLIEVGLAHAQIGAGLNLSAALTLRNLFGAHPELIDAQYDRSLLPGDERLARVKTLLRERISEGADANDYGFVLAYIGRQTGDKELVKEGLSQITGNDAAVSLRTLLEEIWLDGE
jgi:hypothetical protein